MKKTFSIALILFSLLTLVSYSAYAGETNEVIRRIEELPVQHGGRVKPFLSFAKETALYVTGRQRFKKMNPAELVMEWILLPNKWYQKAIVPVAYEPLREEFGLKVIDKRISPEVVLKNRMFTEAAGLIRSKRERGEKITTLEEKKLEVYERAAVFRAVAEGSLPGFFPQPDKPAASWLTFEYLSSAQGIQALGKFYPLEEAQKLGVAYEKLLEETEEVKGLDIPLALMIRFLALKDELLKSRDIVLDKSVIAKEVQYHRLRPFHLSWIWYLWSFLISLTALQLAKAKKGFQPKAAMVLKSVDLFLFIGGFVIQTYGIYLRCVIAGRPPVSNMYESIIWVAWVVVLFAIIYFFTSKSYFLKNAAALVAVFVLIMAQQFPVVFSPAISPLVPVLRSSLWLTTHVLTITMSYGAFALAWGIGHGLAFSFAFHPEKEVKQQKISLYLYRTLQIGIVLLAVGTILGGVWANYSWGRFWGWDPKETWALIALLGYLAVMHGKYAKWYGDFGIAVGSVLGFLGVVMAWYGVNYVLAAGLHSYGFGGGGAGYVFGVAFLDVLLMGFLTLKYMKHKSQNA